MSILDKIALGKEKLLTKWRSKIAFTIVSALALMIISTDARQLGQCVGDPNCKVCSTCNYCGFCAKKGGCCGVKRRLGHCR